MRSTTTLPQIQDVPTTGGKKPRRGKFPHGNDVRIHRLHDRGLGQETVKGKRLDASRERGRHQLGGRSVHVEFKHRYEGHVTHPLPMRSQLVVWYTPKSVAKTHVLSFKARQSLAGWSGKSPVTSCHAPPKEALKTWGVYTASL